MNTPLISIGITHFNASDTIERAVGSALKQDWGNVEVIIVDDCSDIKEQNALKSILKKHPSIGLIIHSDNKGVAAARNTIIERANGDFLAFFDDDDESCYSRLSIQYDRITSYERSFSKGADVICHTARYQIYPNGEERYEGTMGANDGIVLYGEDVALRILTGKPKSHIFGSAATCSQMARLSTYKKLQGFDVKFKRSEDTDFNVRAALSGAHFVGESKALVRQTMTLASDKKLEEEKYYAFKLIEKHKSFIQAHMDYRFCSQWLDAKYDLLQKQRSSFIYKIMWLLLKHPILTMLRIKWALPNIGFNLRFIKFHHDRK